MDTMHTAVLIAHTFIALIITILVLLQRGKGADAGAGFGAGASGTVFGARGSTNFFSRATAILATAFFVSSLTLAYMSSQQTSAPSSVMENAVIEQPADNVIEAVEDQIPDFPEVAVDEAADIPTDMPALEADPADSEAIEGPEQQ